MGTWNQEMGDWEIKKGNRRQKMGMWNQEIWETGKIRNVRMREKRQEMEEYKTKEAAGRGKWEPGEIGQEREE